MREFDLASWGAAKFHNFHEDVDPRYPKISRKSVMRSVEDQADEVVKSIQSTMS